MEHEKIQSWSVELSRPNDEKNSNRMRKKFNWESVSVYIFYVLALFLPIFFMPSIVSPISFGKAFLFYCGIALAFIFWLFARLQNGEVKIPKSGLLVAMVGVISAWFLSSLFSLNPALSFMGLGGNEIGTFMFFLFSGVALFLMSVLFQSEKRVMVFYFGIFISALFAFAFQVFHTLFGITILASGIFQTPTNNLIGSWNDFAIFFGFVALSALCFFELFNFGKKMKAIFAATVGLALLAMLVVNFSTVWIVFALFTLVFLVYLISTSFYSESSLEQKKGHRMARLSLLVLLIAFFFILAKGLLGGITASLNTGIVEVRPSWSATLDVVQKTLSLNPVLGSGPNTFLYDWLKFRPDSINYTMFWNVRFKSGVSHLPSMFATAGVLGGLSLFVFLLFIIYYGMKAVSYSKNDFTKTVLITSFLGSLYLWSFTIFYSPGFLIFTLAFLMTGIFVAALVRTEQIKLIEISFFKNSKIGFVSILLIVLLMIGSVASLYFFFQKYRSLHFYTNAIKELNTKGGIDKSESNFIRAVQIDGQDRYFRALAEIGIVKMRQVLLQKGVSKDILRKRFQDTLGAAIQNAEKATKINPLEPLNWMELARIYESVVPFKISGAAGFGIKAYEKAVELSPMDPSPLIGMARVEMYSNNLKKAENYLNSALSVKRDFTPAIFLLSQIELKKGDLKGAIKKSEEIALLSPNNAGAFFQLGILYYQDKNYNGAKSAFKRAVGINPNYSNARYFLGLIYDKDGSVKKAIEQFKKIEKLNPDNKEVKLILKNLNSGKKALDGISPPKKSPEKRGQPPINEKPKIKK